MIEVTECDKTVMELAALDATVTYIGSVVNNVCLCDDGIKVSDDNSARVVRSEVSPCIFCENVEAMLFIAVVSVLGNTGIELAACDAVLLDEGSTGK